MTKCLITVTEDDIISGKRTKADSCPIAIAIKRKFNTARSFWNHYHGYYTNGNSLVSLSTRSKKACEFVQKFDSGETVKPFKFYVEVTNGY